MARAQRVVVVVMVGVVGPLLFLPAFPAAHAPPTVARLGRRLPGVRLLPLELAVNHGPLFVVPLPEAAPQHGLALEARLPCQRRCRRQCRRRQRCCLGRFVVGVGKQPVRSLRRCARPALQGRREVAHALLRHLRVAFSQAVLVVLVLGLGRLRGLLDQHKGGVGNLGLRLTGLALPAAARGRLGHVAHRHALGTVLVLATRGLPHGRPRGRLRRGRLLGGLVAGFRGPLLHALLVVAVLLQHVAALASVHDLGDVALLQGPRDVRPQLLAQEVRRQRLVRLRGGRLVCGRRLCCCRGRAAANSIRPFGRDLVRWQRR